MSVAESTSVSPKTPRVPSGHPTFIHTAWRVIAKKPGRIVGLAIILFFALMAIVGPSQIITRH